MAAIKISQEMRFRSVNCTVWPSQRKSRAIILIEPMVKKCLIFLEKSVKVALLLIERTQRSVGAANRLLD
jgi:hypothetical protein